LVRLDGSGGGQRLDVVFPVMHGTFGEDGTIQGLLDLAGLPFVGAGVLGSAIGMDKDVAKRLLQVAKIRWCPGSRCTEPDWEKAPKEIQRSIERKFKYPVFVKPATLGSSVGMTKVHSREELAPALNLASEFAMKIFGREGDGGTGDRSGGAGKQRAGGLNPWRNCSAPGVLRYAAKYLEKERALDSGQIEARTSEEDSGVGIEGVSRAGTEWNGARGFFVEKRVERFS